GGISFDPKWAWQSAPTQTGWVSVQVTFPYAVELTRVVVHSQHSGRFHAARAIRISTMQQNRWKRVTTTDLRSVDAAVSLPPTVAKEWRFEFRAGSSKSVVLRGLEFFSGDDQLFPPLVPLQP